MSNAQKEGVKSMSAMLVLLALAAQDEALTMREAAGFAGVTTASMTGTVDRLVILGLLKRWTPEDDRRKVLLGLTEKGWTLTDKCLAEALKVDGRAA